MDGVWHHGKGESPAPPRRDDLPAQHRVLREAHEGPAHGDRGVREAAQERLHELGLPITPRQIAWKPGADEATGIPRHLVPTF